VDLSPQNETKLNQTYFLFYILLIWGRVRTQLTPPPAYGLALIFNFCSALVVDYVGDAHQERQNLTATQKRFEYGDVTPE